MTQPTTQPITIPALKRRMSRCCITIAICAAVIAIAAAIGNSHTKPLTTSSLQIINTCTYWAWPQPTTEPLRKPWEWRTGRVTTRQRWGGANPGGPSTPLIDMVPEYPTSMDISYAGTYLPTGSIVQHPQTYHAGFLSPWLRYRSHTINLIPLANTQPPLTPQEHLHFREEIVDWYTFEQDHSHGFSSKIFTKIDNDPVWLERLRLGDGTMWSIRPLLLIIDLIALAALIAAIVSITKFVRAAIFLRRLKHHNTCPKCRYNLEGIEHQTTNCPECGQTLTLNT